MSGTIPPNTVRAALLPGANIDPADFIRPAPPTRDWMDATPQKYIYRCIPLIAANTMGWELINPVDADILWTGGEMNTDVKVAQHGNRFGPTSHFGVGTVTWYVPFLFRTSPDLGLIITGPANQERNDAVPLDAFVRTDWLPFPFTMNWRLTQTNQPLRFHAGEAIARILPYPLALLTETSLEITDLKDDLGFTAEVEEWSKARAKNVQKQQSDVADWQAGGDAPTGEGVWNSQYVRAKGSNKDGFEHHQTIFKLAKPVDKRAKGDHPADDALHHDSLAKNRRSVFFALRDELRNGLNRRGDQHHVEH